MTRQVKFLGVGLVGLVLASCGPQAPLSFPAPSSTVITAPKASGAPTNIDQANRGLAAAEQTLTLVERAALVYTSLPRCGTGSRVCSDTTVVRKIRAYAIQAHNALISARANESMIEPLWSAINLFRSVVPSA